MEKYFNGEIHMLKDISRLWQVLEIAPECHKKISFQEFLIVGKFYPGQKTPTPLGSLCINIINSIKNSEKLIVYVRSAFDINGRQAGSKISTWLDPQFHTIEEKRNEFLEYCDPNKCLEPHTRQTLYFSLQEDHIHLHHVKESCRENLDSNSRLPKEVIQNLIGEGANFALMRLLAQVKYVGQFETTTLYINGDICRNIYSCKGPESGEVNKKRIDICKIYRRIIERCGITHTCCTILTTSGHIVSHEWEKSEFVVYLNPLVDISTLQDDSNDLPMEKVDGLRDFQLFSKYLDKKQLCQGHINNYIKEKIDIKTVLADYLQTILQMKPKDAIDFTMMYFTRFADAEWIK